MPITPLFSVGDKIVSNSSGEAFEVTTVSTTQYTLTRLSDNPYYVTRGILSANYTFSYIDSVGPIPPYDPVEVELEVGDFILEIAAGKVYRVTEYSDSDARYTIRGYGSVQSSNTTYLEPGAFESEYLYITFKTKTVPDSTVSPSAGLSTEVKQDDQITIAQAQSVILADTNAKLQLLVDKEHIEYNREVWIDANGLFFIKTITLDESTGLQSETNVDVNGAPVTPSLPATPYASGDRELVEHSYTAIADGSGAGAVGWGAGWGDVIGGFTGPGNQYSTGDKILRINIVDPITGGTFKAFWFNETLGLYIAEPLKADIQVSDPNIGQIIETPQVWSDPFAVEFQVFSRESVRYDNGYTVAAIEYSTDGIGWGSPTPPTLPVGVSTPVNFVRLGYISEKATIDYLINRTTLPTVYDAGVGVGHQSNTSLVAGLYNPVTPELNDGDQSELLLDKFGNLKVTIDNVATEAKQNAQIAVAQSQADAIGSETDLSVQNGNDGTVVSLLKGISKSLYAMFDRFVTKQIRIDSFEYTGTSVISVPNNCTKIEIYIPEGVVVEIDGVPISSQIETATISDDHGRALNIGNIEITTAGSSPVFVLTYSF